MRKFILKKRNYCFCCTLCLMLVLLGIPFVVNAEDGEQIHELYHKHVAACEVTGYEDRSAESVLGPSVEETDTCDECGATHHKYRFTASCSCGKTWNRSGHACVNSPYGKYQGSCSNYKRVNTDTTHSHPVKTYGCGMTEESVIGTVTVRKDTVLPSHSVTLLAEAIGDMEEVVLSWTGGNGEAELTVSENGIYSLYISYSESGIEYMHNMEVAVNNIDNEPPTVSEIVADTTEYTAGDVVLSVEVKDTMGLPDNYISWNGEEFAGESNFTVTENGEYEVCVRDYAGNTVTKTITVHNIDKAAPEIVSITKQPNPWYSGTGFITVEAQDAGSGNVGCGLAKEPYSFDGGVTWTANNVFEVSGPQTLTIGVRDAVGNVVSRDLELNYDKQPAKPDKAPDDDKETDSESIEEVVTEEVPSEILSQEPAEEVEVREEPVTEEEASIKEKPSVPEENAEPTVTIETVKVETPDLLTEKIPVLTEVKETAEKNHVRKVVTVLSLILDGVGLGALCLIAYIFLMMCRIYELDTHGKEKHIGNAGIGFGKKGITVKISQRLLQTTHSRSLRIRIPKYFVKRFANKPIRIYAGKTLIEKYVEEKIDFSFKL